MNDAAEERTQRFSIAFTPSELARIDDWRFGQRIGARSDAIRHLIDLGLTAAEAAAPTPSAAKKRRAPAEPARPAPKRKAKA